MNTGIYARNGPGTAYLRLDGGNLEFSGDFRGSREAAKKQRYATRLMTWKAKNRYSLGME